MREDDVHRYEKVLVDMVALPATAPAHERLRRQAIEGFLPLADGMARRYLGRGEPLDDLTQVARLGLVKAVDGFHPDRGGFLGYAVPTIQGQLKRHFRDGSWDVRIPRDLQELHADVRRTADELVQRTGHMPSTTEIADSLHVDEKAVDHAMLANQAYSAASLNAPTRRDDTGSEVGDLIGERDEQVDLVPDRMSLGPALDRLPSRERWILHLRFVDDLSQTDIADRIGLSQMHVSRIISRTLSGLRAWIDGDCDHVDTCHQRRAARQAG